MSVWIDIVAIAAPMLAAGLLGAGLRAPLPHAALPALFALMVGGVSCAYVAVAHGHVLAGVAGVLGAVAALAALALAICARDAELATVGGPSAALLLDGLPSSPHERWHKFERDLWAYIAAHGPGHHRSSPDDA